MPPQIQQPPSANQGMMSLIVALLILNAAGFLLLSIQFIAPKQQVTVVSTGNINAKLDAIQAKLASFQAQQQETVPVTGQPTNTDQNAATGDVAYTSWGLKFSYPQGFSVALIDDSFVQGQKSVRITSQKGDLFLPGGVGGQPGPNQFASGYRMIINQIDAQHDVVAGARLLDTSNPLVKKIGFVCDGVGCPNAKYLVTTSKNTRYVIEVMATSDYKNVDAVSSAIIATISE
jgi:hypothetical protein